MVRNTAVALGGVAVFAAAVLAPLASAFACGPTATLSVAPASASPGAEIAASGRGFSGGSGGSPSAGPVILRFGTTGSILWEGRPDAAGAITASFTVPVASPGTYSVIATQDSADGTPAAGTPARATLEVLPQPTTTTTTTTTTTPPPPITAATASAGSAATEPSPTDPPAAAGQGRATTTTAATATTTTAATTRAPTRGAPVTTSATTTVASSAASPETAPSAALPTVAAGAAAAPVDAREPGAPMVRAGLAAKPVTHTGDDGTPAGVIVAALVAIAAGAGGLTVRRRRSATSS